MNNSVVHKYGKERLSYVIPLHRENALASDLRVAVCSVFQIVGLFQEKCPSGNVGLLSHEAGFPGCMKKLLSKNDVLCLNSFTQ